MSIRDDISKLYKPSKLLEQICVGLFCANIIVSIINLFVSELSSYCTILLLIIALMYMLLSVIDDGYFWFIAERERRKNAIQKAYDVALSELDTEAYYNNSIKDHELSYAANIFESLFFTKEISRRMIIKSCVKSFLAIVVLIVACRFVKNDEILLIVSQTVFSATLVEETIRLILFSQRIRALYDDAYCQFVTNGINTKAQRVWLRWFCVEYESIKAHYKIRLSESIFTKMNPELSKQWECISKQIKTKAK